MDWPQRIDRVIDHARSHPDGDLSVEALARVAHASPFHFGRMFKGHTGETVNRFVRRVRVEKAAELMRSRPDLPLAEVAVAAGLGALSNLSRVFKQVYGIAPTRWDRVARLTPGIEDFADALAALRATAPPLQVQVVERPPLRVAYVRVATPFFDDGVLAAGYAALCRALDGLGLDRRRLQMVGMSWDNPDTTPIDQVRFDLGFAVPDAVDPHGVLAEYRLPAGRYAQVHVAGGKGHIALAWEALYDRWFPASGHEPADLPGIKFFRRRPEELGWQTFDLDCAIALRPA